MSEAAKIDENKQAVASLRAAQANMSKALSRIDELERALEIAASHLDKAASMMPNAYLYNSCKSLKSEFQEYAASARAKL